MRHKNMNSNQDFMMATQCTTWPKFEGITVLLRTSIHQTETPNFWMATISKRHLKRQYFPAKEPNKQPICKVLKVFKLCPVSAVIQKYCLLNLPSRVAPSAVLSSP
jgi:hypothetical protein